jgi:hypothetical protein
MIFGAALSRSTVAPQPADSGCETMTVFTLKRSSMSMRKTDLVKNLAKKLDGKMKTASVPERFAQGAGASKRERPTGPSATKLEPVTCRLPPAIAQRLREHAVTQEGGIHAVITQALENWLATRPGS